MTPSALYIGAPPERSRCLCYSYTGPGLLEDNHGTLAVSYGAATLEAISGRNPAQAWRKSWDVRYQWPSTTGLDTPAAVEDGIWDISELVIQQYSALSEDILVAIPLASDSQRASTPLLTAWTYGRPSLYCSLESWSLDPTFRHKALRVIGPSL